MAVTGYPRVPFLLLLGAVTSLVGGLIWGGYSLGRERRQRLVLESAPFSDEYR